MSEKLRKIKDRASKLHAEGKVKDALKLYEQVVAEDPSEIQCRLKVGDLYKRLGQREAAVKAYEPVARHYAEDGLLLKAIAVCKMILAADPNHAGTQAMLTQLHGKRRAPPTTSGIPLKAAPPRPLMSEAEVLERSFGIVPSERPRPATNDDEEMVIERTSRPSVATKATIPVSPPAPQSPLPASSWPPRPPVAAGPGDVPKSTPSWPVTPNVVQGAPASAPSWPVAPVSASAEGPPPAAWPPRPATVPPPVPPASLLPTPLEDSDSLEDSSLHISVASVVSEEMIAEEVSLDEVSLEDDHEAELKALLGQLSGEDEPLDSPAPAPATPADVPPTPLPRTASGKLDDTWTGQIKVEDVDGPPPSELPVMLTDVIDTAELSRSAEIVASEVPIELTEPSGRSGQAIDDAESARYEASSADVLGQPQIPLFSDLPKNAFVDLLVQMDMKELQPGEYVIKEGDIGDSFFVLATGKVRVSRRADGGSEVILAYLTDGAFFGEMALLQGGPRTASVIVEEEAQIFEIKKELLDSVVERYPSVTAVLKNFYKQRLLSTAMATHPLFRPFSHAERRQLMEMFKSRNFEAGSLLLEEGKKGTGLYIVLYGSLEVSKAQDGGKLTLAELGPGDLFGEMSLLTGKPTVATVQALTECFVLRLSKKKFDEVIMTHPQVLELVSLVSDERSSINQSIMSASNDHGAGTVLV